MLGESQQIQAERTVYSDMSKGDQTGVQDGKAVKEKVDVVRKVSIGLTQYALDRISKHKYLKDLLNSPNNTLNSFELKLNLLYNSYLGCFRRIILVQ